MIIKGKTTGRKTNLPSIYGPKRRINRSAIAKKANAQKASKRKNQQRRKFITYLIIALIFLGIAFAVWRFNSASNRIKFTDGGVAQACDNIFNPQCWTDAFKPSLKQTDGYTNALVVGVDTRPVGEGSDLLNTDSIILLSINHEKKSAMMISIPRDMLVDVQIDGKYCCSMKINGVYALEKARNDVPSGIDLLAENIERMLGLEIHYNGVINFEAVKDAVDAVGGVEVDVPADLVIEYPNDEPPYNYIYVEFKEGKQLLDGKRALAFARFRTVYSGPSIYASDFSRAERQQQVISALKDKALSETTDISQLAQKYWGIYQSISSNIKTSAISFEDALAGISLISDFNLSPLGVVLDPEFGGFNQIIFTAPTDETFGYHIQPRDRTWGGIRAEIDKIWNNADLYREKANITIANKTGLGYPTDSPAIKLQNEKLPIGSLILISEAKTKAEGVYIYDFTGGKMPKTIEYLKALFGTDKVIDDPASVNVKPTGNGEDIKVEIGPLPTPTPSE